MAHASPQLMAVLQAAAAARRQGNSEEELRLLNQALGMAPQDPMALNARGMRALADRDAERARDCFKAAAGADPGEPALWLNVATACRALGDDEGEQESLQTALSLDRINFIANLRLAELHERRGDAMLAAQSWSGVVQLGASIPDPSPKISDSVAHGREFLARHNERAAARLEDRVGSEIAAAGAAGKRFRACVDHAFGRRAIYQNKCEGLYYPFLPADEFFERDAFPWLEELEARTDVIRQEALTVLAKGGEAIRPYVRMESGTPRNKWSPLDNSLDWSACFLWEFGVPNELVCSLCPETAALLKALPQNRIPGKAPTAFFSVLKAGAHIPPHTGVTNTRAIIHLPLIVPPGCRFRVGGEVREWKEGEAFAFDDTIEHEAWNDSDEPRVVLIFDVWNPHLTEAEQRLLTDFFVITTED